MFVYWQNGKNWMEKRKGLFGSPFSHVLSFHDSFLYISNFIDIFILVQKIISWKAGETELICLHDGLRFQRVGRMAKNFRADFELFMGKKKISFPFK